MASNIADGKYNAVPDAASVYEKNGKLCLECRFSLCDGEGTPYDTAKQSKRFWLTSADGAVNMKTVEQVRKWCPQWDGIDPFWFTEGSNFAEVGMVEVVLQTRPYVGSDGQQHRWQDIAWVNPLGDGSRGMVESGDKKAIMAKYGAKFKAAAVTSGKAPAVASRAPSVPPKPAAKAHARKPAPKAPAKPAQKDDAIPAGIDGQEIVWNRYCESLPDGTSTQERDDGWFALLDEVAKDKDQQDFTSDEWTRVAEKIGAKSANDPLANDTDDLPF